MSQTNAIKKFSFRAVAGTIQEIKLRSNQVTSANLGRHFQIPPDQIYLKELYGEQTEFASNGSFDLEHFTNNHVFSVLNGENHTANVRTTLPQQHPSSSIPVFQTPTSQPSIIQSASSSSTVARSVARRTSLFTVKVVRCNLDANGKPTNVLTHNLSTHINIYNEDEANVTHILSRVREEMNDHSLVLVGTNGLLFYDQEGTRGITFWKVGSRKVFAVDEEDIERNRSELEVEGESSSHSEYEPPVRRKRKSDAGMNNELLLKISQDLQETKEAVNKHHVHGLCHKEQFSVGFLSALEEAFECCICKKSPSQPPVIMCKECKSIIGCSNPCVNTWYSGRDALSKNCPKCRTSRGFANTMELKGMDNLLSKLMEITGDNDDDARSTTSTLPLVYDD